MVCGRYAPSPTGPLHLGNLRTALVAWLQARLAGGRIVLRFDDLDAPRNQPGSEQQIRQDLDWLGLDFEPVVYRQSEHLSDYRDAFTRLQDKGQIFPCRCSRKDIQQAASPPDPRRGGLRYPGTCRPQQLNRPLDQSEAVAWRFLVDDNDSEFVDRVIGEVRQNNWTDPGDFVVRRKDGIFAYQLATVVDDGLLGITDVVRGVDLLDSTTRQLALFDALALPSPDFWHVPLMLDDHGEKLSKRDDAMALEVYRQQGMTAAHVIGLLAASLNLVDSGASLSATELAASLGLDQLRQALQKQSADTVKMPAASS